MVCVVAGGSPMFYRSTIIHIFIFSDERKTYILASRVCITYKCPCCCVFHALAHSTHLRFCLCLHLAFIVTLVSFLSSYQSPFRLFSVGSVSSSFAYTDCCNSPSDMTALSHVWSIFDLQERTQCISIGGTIPTIQLARINIT